MGGLLPGADFDGELRLRPDRRRRLFVARCREPRCSPTRGGGDRAARTDRAGAVGRHESDPYRRAHGRGELPELLDLHIRLGEEYGLMPVLPRAIRFAPKPQAYAKAVAMLERAGRPVIDSIRGTLPVAGEAVEMEYRETIEELPFGG